ncbi:MAG: Mur ligase family protein [Myxococcota bacterium]
MTRRATAPIASLAEAASYLEGLINLEKERVPGPARLSLAPIEALLARLDRPDAGLSIFHVAGSKGKGSTALFAEAILLAAGCRVGTFTSPHLESWIERFRIDGVPVAEASLAAAVERVRPEVDALREAGGDSVPSFFDATTAVALLLFQEADVDHAILEVGLGGRLDSTNAVTPAVTAVTQIELEHTDRLGTTLAAIAGEKAGIWKPGVPALMGPLVPEAAAVTEERARAVGAPLFRVGEHIALAFETSATGATLTTGEGAFEVTLALPIAGDHQPANAALAVAAARRLLADSHAPEAIAAAAREGLAGVGLPGRIETLAADPWIVVDSAHTEASARALARVLAERGDAVDFVVSLSAGKDRDAILEAWLPLARSITFTRAEPIRALDPNELVAAVQARRSTLPVLAIDDAEEALRRTRAALPSGTTLCASGSVYLAGIARRLWSDPPSPTPEAEALADPA